MSRARVHRGRDSRIGDKLDRHLGHVDMLVAAPVVAPSDRCPHSRKQLKREQCSQCQEIE
jgi:hypothetical protein